MKKEEEEEKDDFAKFLAKQRTHFDIIEHWVAYFARNCQFAKFRVE